MTSPDKYFPATSVNADPGFSAYASTTQEDYEQTMRDAASGSFSPFSAICMLLGEMPCFGGLLDMGGGSQPDTGIPGGIIGGAQSFMDGLAGLCGCGTAADTTPQSILDTGTALSDQFHSTPFLTGLLQLGGGSQTANTTSKLPAALPFTPGVGVTTGIPGGLMNGATIFADTIGSLLGCDNASGGNTTPQSILDTSQGLSDQFHSNAFLEGLLQLGGGSQTANTSSGLPAALPFTPGVSAATGIPGGLLGGVQTFIELLCSLCSCAGTANTSPQSILDGVSGMSDMFNNTTFLTDLLQMGGGPQTGTGVAGGLFSGAQQFADSLFGTAFGSTAEGVTPQAFTDLMQSYLTAGRGWLGGTAPGTANLTDLFGAADNFFPNLLSIFNTPDLTGDTSIFDPTSIYSHATGTTSDNIVNMLFGWSGGGYTHTDSAAALAQQTDTLTATAAQVQDMWLLLHPPPPTGVSAQDLFTRSAGTLGADWSEVEAGGGGNWGTDGQSAVWHTGYGTTDSRTIWQGANPASITDYQTLSLVLSSGPTSALDSFFIMDYGHNDLCARMSADLLDCIRFRISADASWKVSRFIANTETVMWAGTLPAAPGAGTSMTLVCGDYGTSTPRHFKAMVNNTILVDAAEVGTGSLYGSGHRGWGFGGRQEIAFLVAGVPGAVNLWQGQDSGT